MIVRPANPVHGNRTVYEFDEHRPNISHFGESEDRMRLAPNKNPEEEARVAQMFEHPESYPGLIARPRSKVLLRIWRYQVHLATCWAVLECEDGLYLRRVALDSFRKSTYGSETRFEKAIYDQILSKLEMIRVAPFDTDKSLVGLDGTSYGVEQDTFGASTRLSWWESEPAGWKDLREWHRETTELFDSALPVSTARVETEDIR
jgi:hypothetical protein